jgi:hypothetical protein
MKNLSPVEIDTIYLDRLRDLSISLGNFRNACDSLLWTYATRRHFGRQTLFLHPDEHPPVNADYHTLAECRRVTAADLVELHRRGHEKLSRASREVSRWEQASAELAESQEGVEEIDREYQSRPWSRYWLVTSSDGHIHRSPSCSTCNRGREPTGFALVPYLSGSPVEEAVADLGPALCSRCFPEAPVESLEQARIPARVALSLAEEGCEAFQAAREKARQDAAKRAAERCPGAGQVPQGPPDPRGLAPCPSCGRRSRVTRRGVLEAHREVRWRVSRQEDSLRLYWAGDGAWTPSRGLPLPRAEAEAVQAGHPGSRLERTA